MSRAERTKPVGVVGLGALGSPLAVRLADAGFQVFGFDPVEERTVGLIQRGGVSLESPSAVAQLSHRVLIAAGETFDVESLLWGDKGLLTGAKRPTHVIDASTSDPDRASSIATRLDQEGVEYIDATFAGSHEILKQGKALMMIGGGGGAVGACTDILQSLSRRSFHVGGPGQGTRARLALTLVASLNRAALAEGIAFAEKLGLDTSAFIELLRASPGQSAAIEAKAQKMLQGDYRPQARLKSLHNDVRVMLRYSQKIGQGLPFTELHSWLLAEAIEHGEGELDTAAILEAIKRQRAAAVAEAA